LRRLSIPRPVLLLAAALFAAATILHGALWMYCVRQPGQRVELGFNFKSNLGYDPVAHSLSVGDVVPGSPAERAGLQAGDRIVGVNSRLLDTSAPYDEAWSNSRPGDPVELIVQRPGAPGPIVLHGVFRQHTPDNQGEGALRSSVQQVTASFPVLFMAVGLAVLFLRVEDRFAWLLAVLFAGFAAAPSLMNLNYLHPALRGFAMAFRGLFFGSLFSVFCYFFALFPAPSPLERRAPWLKWAGFALAILLVIPGIRTGVPQFPSAIQRILGPPLASHLQHLLAWSFVGLGTVSLAGNSFTSSPETRRKSRVILWGTLLGFLPIVLQSAASDFAGFHAPFWLNTVLVILLLLYPLSFAYAIVKHRVLEIPALLRRSARYVLVQRGFYFLLVVAAGLAILLFTRVFVRFVPTGSTVGMPLSALFGVLLVWASAPVVRRGAERIDQAFFRSAYDARVILQDLAEKTRTASGRHELASLLAGQIEGALRPTAFVCYLETGATDAGQWKFTAEYADPPAALPPIFAGAPLLEELTQRGRTWEVPPEEVSAVAGALGLPPALPECLIPILGRDSRLLGLIVLGQKLSEESYSLEDKRLLDSVANQAGAALENIQLAERMAERMEAERRAAQEMEIARQVQSKLLPQKAPPLATLDYAGICVQARAVGGDFYDFLELGQGRVGFVLADIAGKGMPAALLMANLQAHLRSQAAILAHDLPQSLRSVNRMFFDSTQPNNYATLFLGVYNDGTRRLRYVNCGHNPPLLLRQGQVTRLPATATVLGLFENWDCETAILDLAPGDVLAMFTDGIIEAADAKGEEFGEGRLARQLQENSSEPAGRQLNAVVEAVRSFAPGEQGDDLTLLIACAR
jgi:sigma-B regulation protein RsbU (phosphoserine phosphatase)